MHRGLYMSPEPYRTRKSIRGSNFLCTGLVDLTSRSAYTYRTALPPDSQLLPGAEKTSHRRRSVAPAERRVLTKESEYESVQIATTDARSTSLCIDIDIDIDLCV